MPKGWKGCCHHLHLDHIKEKKVQVVKNIEAKVSTKKTYHKERREADSEHSATIHTEDLLMTIIEYMIDMDNGLLRTIVLNPTNTLFEKYTKDKPKPKPYRKANCWDRPLAKAPGGRIFEVDVNRFLRLISKEIKEDITRSDMEGKVLEVG
jgi:hypothetical protein